MSWRQVVALIALAVVATTAAAAGDPVRGRALYDGTEPLVALGDDGAIRPAAHTACVHCHRRSGLGSFEGALSAPPITGPMLFQPLDRDTGGFFRSERRDRVRPAYDEASLRVLLSTGVAPDGVRLRGPMPRYAIEPNAAADLAAYLRTLGARPDPGVDGQTLHLATVLTPDVAIGDRRTVEAVVERFVALKNAQTRRDTSRLQQTLRSHEMAMNRKFRVWQHSFWLLDGPESDWAAQLARWQREHPAFALVGGLGQRVWAPVHAFCEEARVPCMLPLLDEAPAPRQDFYSVYFHPGRSLDLQLAAQWLRQAGAVRVALWGATPPDRAALLQAGLVLVEDGASDAVLSLLPPADHLKRVAHLATASTTLAWAPGAVEVSGAQWTLAAAPIGRGVMVTPWRPLSGSAEEGWPRTASWLRQQRLEGLSLPVAAATLQALTSLGDALTHLDFGFTRDYLLELLEHGLENQLPFGPYERLAIAPGQRIGAKGSHLAEVRGGQLQGWRWQPAQNREITSTEASALPLR